MEKTIWKPGTMLYPLPAIMVSCGSEKHEYNIITIAWTGTICSDPPMTYISVRKERHSHQIIKKNKAFVMNLTTEALAFATDFCGVKSGREVDKFSHLKLTPVPATKVPAPLIHEAPVNIECRVTQIIELGSHDMFMAEVVAVHADTSLIDEKGKFHLDNANLLCYSHGEYYGLKRSLGKFGYSIMKKKTRRNNRKKP
ncbi:MAG: flavin reductase family protein [Clostridiales bacterium]|nr:flavin reductase family protein [Clostridiales bacterium]